MISQTFRTDDSTRWGGGKGANLTPNEVDRNFWELKAAIEDLIGNPPSPVEIAAFSVIGAAMTIQMTNGNVIGPLPLPVLSWRWRDAWMPFVPYAQLDIFKVDGIGIFLVLLDHTSAATFDPAALSGGSQPLYKQLFGISTIDKPLTVAVFLPATQPSGAIARIMMTDAGHFPANFAGSFAAARIASLGTAVFTTKINTTTIGTITFPTSASGTLATTGGLAKTFVAGDFVEIGAPTAQDTTLADIAFGLRAIRDS